MKEDGKILTLHPQNKKGVRIDESKYFLVRNAIVTALSKNAMLTHTELMSEINRDFNGSFDGSLMWYAETVKLDLEARKIIKRKLDSNIKKFVYEFIHDNGG